MSTKDTSLQPQAASTSGTPPGEHPSDAMQAAPAPHAGGPLAATAAASVAAEGSSGTAAATAAAAARCPAASRRSRPSRQHYFTYVGRVFEQPISSRAEAEELRIALRDDPEGRVQMNKLLVLEVGNEWLQRDLREAREAREAALQRDEEEDAAYARTSG